MGGHARNDVQVAIKHIEDSIDSSVLFEDIAATIDNGEKATAEQKAKAIIGCGSDGGTFVAQANLTNPAYKADSYIKAGFKTTGLLVKVTKAFPA